MPCALLLRRHLVDEGGAGHHPDDRQGDDESREHPRRPPLAPPPCVQRAGRRQELGLPRSERHTASGQVRLGLRERRPGEQQVLRLALGSPLLRPSLEGGLCGHGATRRCCHGSVRRTGRACSSYQVAWRRCSARTRCASMSRVSRAASAGPERSGPAKSCPRRPCGVIEPLLEPVTDQPAGHTHRPGGPFDVHVVVHRKGVLHTALGDAVRLVDARRPRLQTGPEAGADDLQLHGLDVLSEHRVDVAIGAVDPTKVVDELAAGVGSKSTPTLGPADGSAAGGVGGRADRAGTSLRTASGSAARTDQVPPESPLGSRISPSPAVPSTPPTSAKKGPAIRLVGRVGCQEFLEFVEDQDSMAGRRR